MNVINVISIIILLFFQNMSSTTITRNPSRPFISSISFASIANHVGNNVRNIRKGDIIYIDNFHIQNFFSHTHPRLNAPYILISHGGWPSVPGNACARYLDSPKLIAWFGKNIDRLHPKLHPLPIGIPTPASGCGNINTVHSIMKNAKDLSDRRTDKLIYINLTWGSNPKERLLCINTLKDKPFTYISGIYRYATKIQPFAQYLKELSEFRFVASPNGLGVDCHRTWEAMLVGTIPIITRSFLTETILFDDLPVLIIDDWSQITKEFLDENFKKIMSRSYNLDKLQAQYWFNKIRAIQKLHR